MNQFWFLAARDKKHFAISAAEKQVDTDSGIDTICQSYERISFDQNRLEQVTSRASHRV